MCRICRQQEKKLEIKIDYCQENNIDEKTFAQIALKIEKEQNKKDYYAVVCTFNDGSQCFYKGNRAITYKNEISVADKYILYTSLAIANKAKESFESKKSDLEKEFAIKQFILD